MQLRKLRHPLCEQPLRLKKIIPRRAGRRLCVESLESRRLLVGEGEVYSLTRNIDAFSLAGNYGATISWGDGTTSAGTVTPGTLDSKLTARIDYSLDTSGFFTSARRQVLQAVVDSIVGRFSDTLTAIQPGGSNSWTAIFDHPSQNGQVSRTNLQIAQNELLIYAGARPMTSPQLGEGGFGGFSGSGTSAFLSNLSSRGQGNTRGATANDFGPWGGSISFNTNTNWYFGTDPDGIASNEQDFITVAAHEMFHLLGFGVSDSWQRLVSGSSFTGANSRAQYDGSGNVPLSADRGHWQIDLQDNGAETLLDPNQTSGTRKLPTPLDVAGLKDVGWSIPSSTVRVTANHVYPDNGTFPIGITLTGSRLGSLQQSLTTNITNTAPTLIVPGTRTVVAGQTLSITNIGQISDPGFRNSSATPATNETFTYSIDWGDGSDDSTGTATIDQIGNTTRPTLASFNGSHLYTSAGTYTVRVTARDDDGGTTNQSFSVNVQAPPTIAISSNRSRVVEDGSVTAVLTLRRSGGDLSQPLTVNLSSSDSSEASVASSTTFPAGQASITVPLIPVDDDLLDGDQAVTVTVSATGITPASVDLVVADAERIIATVLTSSILENAGPDAARIRISRSNTNTGQALPVTISGSNPTLLESATSVTIPAGQQQVVLTLDSVDDSIHELTKTLTLAFNAAGYAGASATITILDDEPPLYQNPTNPFDVNNDKNVQPIDALQVINYLNRDNAGGQLDPELGLDLPFYDVSGDYIVQPIDALRIINFLNRGGAGLAEGEAVTGSVPSANSLDQFHRDREDEEERLFDLLARQQI